MVYSLNKITQSNIFHKLSVIIKKKPKVGLLMIPKTCAYMWVIVMGLELLFR